MTISHLLVTLAAAISSVQAHFAFARVRQNGEWLEPTRYIRNKTSPFTERDSPDTNYHVRRWIDPTYAVTDYPDSVRCGRDNMAHAADTEVLTIRAGDQLEFAHQRKDPEWPPEMWNNCPDERGSCDYASWNPEGYIHFNHPGPFIAHLSKVPEGQDIHSYDGSGEWVKIYTLGLELRDDQQHPIHWIPWNDEGIPAPFAFSVPKETPDGDYLLRADLVYTGVYEFNFTSFPSQLYPSCLQIRVESDYEGSLPKGIRIPEDMMHDSPGMNTSLSMYRFDKLDDDYVYPGGMLWTGKEMVVDKP
ncbi:glycosyl hydrolase family 61-domain-containing protein [Xylaria bambusicola]|uniref:glycosyl hydrolase family 61-domain-containing protein n=1 Tax=Xylaria bambusicola TaxID=326684 RepID=UPI00200824B5|nr:glycosyl hydrolase family 61-domain-containing protein [Xylaria bambusicola]KAI0513300.1 glycosyl hydrolase family 61-domain-containing protein [Xylaria bambusicola]